MGFVGPRPLRTGDPLFGRAQELFDLTNLVIGERVVLLYSPSGAGKTSLVQAGLVVELRGRGFDPPADRDAAGDPTDQAVILRVNTPAPAGGGNRYARSAMLALENRHPVAARKTAPELAGLTLADYLESEFPRPVSGADDEDEPAYRPPVLIFDQFEEVLTLDPTDVPAKKEFFRDLGRAVADRSRWFVFAMREDYLAELEPYLGFFPRRLAARCRIDRLRPAAAVDAVVNIGATAGVTILPAAAEELVTELRKLRKPRADGVFVPVTAPDGTHLELPYVEPVYLQVVGLRLLDGKAPGAVVACSPLAGLAGDGLPGVDRVLARFYADAVAEAAGPDRHRQRQLRRWFDRSLLNRDGRRVTARPADALEFGVSDPTIAALERKFVLRRVVEGAVLCYELAHDRLAGAVRWDNIRWRRQNLTPFERAAAAWAETAEPRPPALLVGGPVLRAGEAAARAGRLDDDERAYLRACQAHRTRTRRRWAVATVALLGLVVGAFDYQARGRNEAVADQQRKTTQVDHQLRETQAAQLERDRWRYQRNALTSTAQLLAASNWDDANPAAVARAALDLMAKAAALPDPGGPPGAPGEPLPPAETALRDALRRLGWVRLSASRHPIQAVAVSPNGAWIAAGGDGWLGVWAAGRTGTVLVKSFREHNVTAVAFSPDGSELAVGTGSGRVSIVALPDGRTGPVAGKPFEDIPLASIDHPGPIGLVRYFPPEADGRRGWVVAAGADGGGYVWRRGVTPVPDVIPLTDPDGDGRRLVVGLHPGAADPARPRLYTGTRSGHVVPWVLADGGAKALHPILTTDAAVTALAVHPRGDALAVAGTGPGVGVWTLDPVRVQVLDPTPDTRIQGVTAASLAYHPAGDWLAVGSGGGVRLFRRVGGGEYEPATGQFGAQVGRGVPGRALDPGAGALPWAFDHGGGPPLLVRGGTDPPVRVWSLDAERAAPFAPAGGDFQATAVAVSPNRDRLVAGGQDGSVHVWDLRRVLGLADAEPRVFRGPDAAVARVAGSPDGKWVAALDRVGRVSAWEAGAFRPAPRLAVAAPRAAVKGPFLLADTSLAVQLRHGAVPVEWRLNPFGAAPAAARDLAPRVEAPHRPTVWTPDGKWVASLTRATGEVAPAVRPADRAPPAVPASMTRGTIALSPDARWAATEYDGDWSFWPIDPADGSPGHRVPLPLPHYWSEDGPTGLAVHPDGLFVAAGFAADPVCVWDLRDGRWEPRLHVLPDARGARAVAFTPDGQQLAVAGTDGKIRLWEIPLRPQPYLPEPVVLTGHEGEVTAVEYAGAGAALRLVSGGADGTVRVWAADTKTLTERAESLLKSFPADRK